MRKHGRTNFRLDGRCLVVIVLCMAGVGKGSKENSGTGDKALAQGRTRMMRKHNRSYSEHKETSY